ncbi:hypothetical protein LTR56_002183 [Elasticomyces elasticus]|nr:hypothetical protein LTR56_002183 [Elasticomyces elasticus]
MAFHPFEPPVDIAMPAYFIYRDTPPGQPYDPAAPPVYFPPRDSDELFDALRMAFPHVKSHTERMRDAMIKFLLEERDAEQLQNSINTFPDTTSATPSEWQQSWPSMSSSGTGSSTFSSPELFDLATPTFGMSPMPQVPQLSRQYSSAPSVAATSNGEGSPPALEGMTGVFSVSTTDQPKQRIRRKMTEAEKAEYRKRRIVKACEKCSKRKRKCVHNQPEMETLAPKQKVTKISPPTAKPVNMQKVQQALVDFDNFTFDGAFGTDMPLFDDFTGDLEDPMLHFDTRSEPLQNSTVKLPPSQNQWQWQDWQQDGIPIDGRLSHVGEGSINDRASGMQNTTAGRNLQTATSGNNANSNEALRFDQIGGDPQWESGGSGGTGMTWEATRSDNASATYAHQVPDADGRFSDICEDRTNNRAGRGRETSLSTSVLRVAGATKAIRAFGRKLKSNGPMSIMLQLATLSTGVAAVAGAHRSTLSSAPIQARNDFVHEDSTFARFSNAEGNFRTKQKMVEMFSVTDPKACHPSFLHDSDAVGRDTNSERMASNGPLEGMCISDYLRMKSNCDDIDRQMGRGGQALPSCIADASKNWSLTSSTTTSKELASTSVPATNRTLFNQEPVTREGRPAFTFGESNTKPGSSSTELYLLKRRIPKAIHSTVDRDNWGIPTPLLQAIPSDQVSGGAYQRLDAEKSGRSARGDAARGRFLQGLALKPSGATDYQRLPTTTMAYPLVHPFSVTAPPVETRASPMFSNLDRSRNAFSRADVTSSAGGSSVRDVYRDVYEHGPRSTPLRHNIPADGFDRTADNAEGSSVACINRTERSDVDQDIDEAGPVMDRAADNFTSTCDVYVHRKRSTFRNKDHFGRAEVEDKTKAWGRTGSKPGSQELLRALTALCGMLLLAAFLPVANAHAAVLFILVLASMPPSDEAAKAKGDHERTTSQFISMTQSLLGKSSRGLATSNDAQGTLSAIHRYKKGPGMLAMCFQATTGRQGSKTWQDAIEKGRSES